MSQPNVFIKQSDVDDDVELERAVVHRPSSNLSAASASNLSAAAGDMMFTLDGIDDDAAEAKEERRASSMPKLASLSVNKKTLVGCTVLGVVGTIVGVAIGGAAEHKQQQNALAAINGGGGTNPSKSGKSGPFCDTEPSVVCGQTVTGTAVLNEDLFCTDLIECSTPDVVLKTLNAAVKVVGADAVIDCKGHTIRQLTSKSAASCEDSPGLLFTNSNKRKKMKEECDLFYQAGIWLVDGATAINCNVEHFYDGFLVQNGGEVKKSEASRNRGGVDILDDIPGSMTKISDVYAHSNGDGIRIGGSPMGNVVTIEDFMGKNNLRSGMALRGPNIKVKDSTTSHNVGSGIRVVGMEISNPTKVQFEGTVSSHHNGASIPRAQIQIERHLEPGSGHGVEVTRNERGSAPFYADVTVKGELNTYQNGIDGLFISYDSNMVGNMYEPLGFTVEAKGSFNSCNNGEYDIGLPGTANFVDEGTDGYTCETKGGSMDMSNFPTCEDCADCE